MYDNYDQDYLTPYQQQEEKPPEFDWGAIITNGLIAASSTQTIVFIARHNSGLQPFSGVLLLAVLGASLTLALTAKDGYMRFFALMGFGAVFVGVVSALWDFVGLIFSDFSGYFLPYQIGAGFVILCVVYILIKLLNKNSNQY